MLRPLFAESPIEMGAHFHRRQLLTRLESDGRYTGLFALAFPLDAEPLTWQNIIKAIACFERTLISGQSAYDLWLFSDIRPSPSIVRGMGLFFSTQINCGGCHGGIGFNNEFYFQGLQNQDPQYHFTGLTGKDRGLGKVTGRSEDNFYFKAPSLRNIAVTAPYMHDGRYPDLESVILHYERGPAPAHRLRGFQISDEDRADLIAFLRSLTDEKFLDNRYLSNPNNENLK